MTDDDELMPLEDALRIIMKVPPADHELAPCEEIALEPDESEAPAEDSEGDE